MARATFTIIGEIGEFDRIDNLYRALKREGQKALTNWEIRVQAEYVETEAEHKE